MAVLVEVIPLVGTDPRCGSNAGYQAHLKASEAPCESCRAASREYARQSTIARKRRELGDPEWAPGVRNKGPVCGTLKGYHWHRRHGEEPCVACKKANSQHQAQYRKNHPRDVEKEREYDRARYRRMMSTPEGREKLNLRGKLRQKRRNVQSVPGAPVTPAGLRARYEFFGWRCWMCGCDLTSATVTMDHVKPLSAGGLHVLANLRPACQSCNSRKHNKWGGVSSGKAA